METSSPKVGQVTIFTICGSHYRHVVIEVISAKKIVVAHLGNGDDVIGPREMVSLRRGGQWVCVGSCPSQGRSHRLTNQISTKYLKNAKSFAGFEWAQKYV